MEATGSTKGWNGVDPEIFGALTEATPSDLPAGSPIIGYHGSLYGNWFDWQLLSQVALAYPRASLVVIGDTKSGHPPMPDNVHFLGMKAQHELPAYISRFDVGVIPFGVSETTHAVSPLKVFEYLASGVPVAAPPLRSLAGLSGVHTASSLVAAIADALAAPKPDRSTALEEHGWAARVDGLFEGMGLDRRRTSEVLVKRDVRPVVRYEEPERVIRRS